MASGVFDILHVGHLYYLEEAKKLGDELIVVVARDSTVRKNKHEPIMSENMRLEMVKSLKPVDKAFLGYENNPYKIVEEIKPDIIAIGYDQTFDIKKLKKDLSERGLNIQIVRLERFKNGAEDLDGTRKIIRKIVDWWSFKEKMKHIEGDKSKK